MKRLLSILAAAAVGAALVLPVGPARAAADAPTVVPDEVQITDPFGDANYLNDQGTLPDNDDTVTGDDVGSVSDLGKIWFSHTAKEFSVHIQTEAPAPASTAVQYRVFASPGEGEAGSSTLGCLRFAAVVPGNTPGGGTYQGKQFVKLQDYCNAGTSIFNDSVDATLTLEELEDGTGLVTITGPRSYSPLLANGAVVTAPQVEAVTAFGGDGPTGPAFTNVPKADTTKVGTDYTISASKPKPDGPKVPKKCKKLKGKARKRCIRKATKPKPTKGCAAYAPGDQGADAPTAIVTDAATEEAPVEITLPIDAGFGTTVEGVEVGEISHVFQNVQVDSKSAATGLWVRLEMPEGSDHDLYLNNPDGTTAARAAGFNPIAEDVDLFNDTAMGGHTETTAEQLDGIKTADCQGYTVDVAAATGDGSDVTLKLWLGDANFDPAAPTG